MTEYVELKDLWTEQEQLDVKSDRYWLKLRVLESTETQQKYYDILGGIKGQEPHIHYGFDLLGNQIFDRPRNQIQKVRKMTDSSLYGRTSDETKILKNTSPKINFILSITPDGTSKESKVTRFEITPDPPE